MLTAKEQFLQDVGEDIVPQEVDNYFKQQEHYEDN